MMRDVQMPIDTLLSPMWLLVADFAHSFNASNTNTGHRLKVCQAWSGTCFHLQILSSAACNPALSNLASEAAKVSTWPFDQRSCGQVSEKLP